MYIYVCMYVLKLKGKKSKCLYESLIFVDDRFLDRFNAFQRLSISVQRKLKSSKNFYIYSFAELMYLTKYFAILPSSLSISSA